MALQLTKLTNGTIAPDYTLADAKRTYSLLINGTETFIPKPKSWDGLDIKFKRDRKWHGFYPETSEEGQVVFYANQGRELIIAEYASKGQDAVITFREYANDAAGTVLLEGEYLLNMNKFTKKGNEITVTVNRKSIEQTISARWDTKINLDADETIDGFTNLTDNHKPVPINISLHSKSVGYTYKNLRDEPSTIEYEEKLSVSKNYFIQLDTQDPQIDEINTSYKYELGVSTLYPVSFNKPLFTVQESGYYSFDLDVSFQFDIELLRANISLSIDIGNWYLKYYLFANGNMYEFSGSLSGSSTTQQLGKKTFTGSYSGTHYIPQTSNIYIFGQFNFQPTRNNWRGSNVYLKNFNTSFDITAITTTKKSLAYGFTPEESAKFLLRCIANTDAELKSNYFSNTNSGCGSKNLLLNGYMIRLQGVNPMPAILPRPTFSLRDFMLSFQAMDGVGFGYEFNATTNKDVFRIEPYDYFYQDTEIMRIESMDWSSYEESIASEYIYNKIKIGYEKYAKEGTQVLDEFNTEHEYQTPIKTQENEFVQKSPFSASGYLIESQRRLVYNTDSKTSGSDDDTNFVISTVKTSTTTPETHVISFREPYQFDVNSQNGDQTPIDPGNTFLSNTNSNYFVAGGTIIISGTSINNGTFYIEYVEFLPYINKYLIQTTEVIDQEFGVTATISGQDIPLKAETDEFFTVTAGTIIDPKTAYNLRKNPKYMLLNHAKLLNSGFRYKASSEKLSSQSVIQNSGLIIQRKPTDTCVGADAERKQYKMDDDIVLASFNNFGKYFKPEICSFKTIMYPEQVRYIINAHRGLNTSGKNYGYLTFVNIYKEEIQGYLLELSYDKKKSEANFTFVKKNS